MADIESLSSANSSRRGLMPLESARWFLAVIWFPVGGLIFIVLIGQSIGGAYGEELQRVWGWALPNFLPTLALMVSVFAADALRPHADEVVWVRRNFCYFAAALSIFYLSILMLSILAQPFIQYLRGPEENSNPVLSRIQLLETSNLWLAPIQGLVVVSLGVLFFLKESEKLQTG